MKKYLWATVLAVACFSVFTCGISRAAEKVSFQDDFATFDTAKWYPSLEDVPDKGVFVKDGALFLEGYNARVTSRDTFRYCTLEVRMKMTQETLPKKWHYLGFFQRERKGDKWERWGESACFLMSETGAGFILKIGKSGQGMDVTDTGVFKVDDWHTIKVAWSPDRVELFIDGDSKGFSEDKSKIPADFMPVVFDLWSEGNVGVCGMAIDWIKVAGGEVKRGS